MKCSGQVDGWFDVKAVIWIANVNKNVFPDYQMDMRFEFEIKMSLSQMDFQGI